MRLRDRASECWHHIQPEVCCWCADDSPVQRQPDAGTCTEVVSADGLVERLHERAQAAVNAGSTVRAMPVSIVKPALRTLHRVSRLVILPAYMHAGSYLSAALALWWHKAWSETSW